MNGGVVGDAVKEEDLVEAEAEEDLDGRFLSAILGFSVDEPVEGGFPADDAEGKFLQECPVEG